MESNKTKPNQYMGRYKDYVKNGMSDECAKLRLRLEELGRSQPEDDLPTLKHVEWKGKGLPGHDQSDIAALLDEANPKALGPGIWEAEPGMFNKPHDLGHSTLAGWTIAAQRTSDNKFKARLNRVQGKNLTDDWLVELQYDKRPSGEQIIADFQTVSDLDGYPGLHR